MVWDHLREESQLRPSQWPVDMSVGTVWLLMTWATAALGSWCELYMEAGGVWAALCTSNQQPQCCRLYFSGWEMSALLRDSAVWSSRWACLEFWPWLLSIMDCGLELSAKWTLSSPRLIFGQEYFLIAATETKLKWFCWFCYRNFRFLWNQSTWCFYIQTHLWIACLWHPLHVHRFITQTFF